MMASIRSAVLLLCILYLNVTEIHPSLIIPGRSSLSGMLFPTSQENCRDNLTFSTCSTRECKYLKYPNTRCLAGCGCPNGQVFESSDSKKCIRKEQCDVFPSCGSFEVYQQSGSDSICSVQYSIPSEGCHCKEGYIRPGVGLPCAPKPCPAIECGENKIFKTNETIKWCGQMSQNSGISVEGPLGIGMNVRSLGSVSGQLSGVPGLATLPPGCYCIDGYIATDSSLDKCIPENTCKKCGQTEIYSVGGCMQTCDDLRISYSNQNNSSCSLKVEANSCVCVFPYVAKSASDPECVHISSCPDLCSENEVFMNSSLITDCATYTQGIKDLKEGGPGCYCDEGYLRAIDSQECIPMDQCYACGDRERYSRSSIPDSTCDDWAILKNTFVDLTLTHESDINGTCYCKKGYVRDSKNKCIPTSECPSPPSCGPNQLFQETGEDGYCDGVTETTRDNDPRCYCKSGYVRNYRNECIPEDDCPNCEENDPNSFFSPCVHCYDYCNGTRLCKWTCLGDCDCKPGFVYNEHGICIHFTGCKEATIYPDDWWRDPILAPFLL